MKFGTLLQLYKDKKYEKDDFIDYQKIKSTKFSFKARIEFFNQELNKLEQLLKKHIENRDELYDISRWLLINQISVRKLVKKLAGDGLKSIPDDLELRINRFLNEKLDNLTMKQAKFNGTAPTGNTFERKSVKYIIPEIYIHLVIEYLTKYVGIVKYGNTETPWTFIRSVYLDNEKFDLYYDRLKKNPDSITLRYRKYDNLDKIFLERKKHSDEVYENSFSKKERIEVLFPSNNIYPYEIGKLSEEFDNIIQTNKLIPSIGISYSRLSFGDEQIRICLDSNIVFSDLSEYKESIMNSNTPTNKKKKQNPLDISKLVQFPIKSINLGKDKRFHFAVLEVKITSKENESCELPPWLETLIQSEWIISIPKLSKFLTGSYYIHNNIINMLFPNEAPYWIPQIGTLLDRFSPINPTNPNKNHPQLLVVPKGLRPEILINLDKVFIKRTMLSFKMLLLNLISNRKYYNLPLLMMALLYFIFGIVSYYLDSKHIINRQLRNVNYTEKILLTVYFFYFIISFLMVEYRSNLNNEVLLTIN